MKIIMHGGLARFPEKLKFLNDRNIKFSVHTSGATRKIKYSGSDYGMRFSDGSVKGVFLCGMVKKDVNNYIFLNGIPKVNYDVFDVTKYNPALIEKNIGFPMKAIDCNHFYWTISYKLGYITKDTYERGIEKPSYKTGRLAAIGMLNKLELIEDYENGVKIWQNLDFDTFNKYSPFWKNVIIQAWNLMEDVFEKFPKNVCMWLTDCAYVNVDDSKRIAEYILDRGYTTKMTEISFMDIDQQQQKVRWFDYKENRDKAVSYTQYSVEEKR